jgi:hypothetical protein
MRAERVAPQLRNLISTSLRSRHSKPPDGSDNKVSITKALLKLELTEPDKHTTQRLPDLKDWRAGAAFKMLRPFPR